MASEESLRSLRALMPGLESGTCEELAKVPVTSVPPGTVLFRPGDRPPGFVLLLEGAISVTLTGRSGREIVLYEVQPGETCVQTTMCLLGEQVYSAEGTTRGMTRVIIVPPGQFRRLLESSPGFRGFVFRSFGTRLADVTSVLEQVAFVRIEARLAGELLRRADPNGVVTLTHQELAAGIGSAREVVSRRLEILAREGLVALDRGQIRIVDSRRLREIAEIDASA